MHYKIYTGSLGKMLKKVEVKTATTITQGTSLAVQWLGLSLPMQGRLTSSVREVRSHMPHGQRTETHRRSNTAPNPIKALKMVHSLKKKNNPLKKAMTLVHLQVKIHFCRLSAFLSIALSLHTSGFCFLVFSKL